MSEAILLQNTVNKPGTSCLGCRRRKLKCSREPEGCLNCTKSHLPCVYPQPELGVRRKRGAYKKENGRGQRHWEELVTYLEPKRHRPHGFAHSSQEAKVDHGAWADRYNGCARHPPLPRILEYWHIFVTRVDPMTKIIHCPTFAPKLFAAIANFSHVPSATEAITFAVYYAALSTCTAREVRRKFGEAQDVLMHRYARSIEAALGKHYAIPQLEALQALVLYIVCIRRADDGTSIRALFSLAVRSAQLVGLDQDPQASYPPFEAELRRRLWFHLCGLECRMAEEGGSSNTAILKDASVQVPANLNDNDLDPRMIHPPQSRVGVTEMTFPILRFELHRLVFALCGIRKERNSRWAGHEASGQSNVRERQNEYYEQTKARLESVYMQYMHTSRSYDWLCTNFVESMLIKARLIIEFPFGTTPTKDMSKEERMTLLQASVDIIEKTHGVANDERIADYNWFFRGHVPWHSLAIVVAELGWSTNLDFANHAWAVLDLTLGNWDRMYQTKRDEPAWQHVHTLIERARHIRQQRRQYMADPNLSSQKRTRTDISDPALQQTPRFTPPVMRVQQMLQYDHGPLSHRQSRDIMGNSQYNYPEPEAPASHSAITPAINHGSSLSGPCSGTAPVTELNLHFDPFAGMENVDFNAFNEVFNDGSWELLDNLEDAPLQIRDESSCGNWWNPSNPATQPAGASYQYQAHP